MTVIMSQTGCSGTMTDPRGESSPYTISDRTVVLTLPDTEFTGTVTGESGSYSVEFPEMGATFTQVGGDRAVSRSNKLTGKGGNFTFGTLLSMRGKVSA
mmetsp:Transcript_19151/g.52600  ORF Transcript_19151/g.52600 Transcript_19151/m.52600 type:complete len:99 (+) Transcript_19151:2-298(+)